MRRTLARESLAALAADLRHRSAADPDLVPFAEGIEEVDFSTTRPETASPDADVSVTHLAPALEAARGAPRLLAATRAIAGALDWYQIFRGEGIDPGLANGMRAAQIVGRSGILASDRLYTGLFLLAPGIHYPLHTHAAAEIYCCMSGTLTLQHGTGGGPFRLAPGQYSVTPVNRLHSLTTSESPVLLLYVWIGAVDSANWWWERAPEGGWLRVKWSRMPDSSWARSRAEPVTEAHMREAHGQDGFGSVCIASRPVPDAGTL